MRRSLVGSSSARDKEELRKVFNLYGKKDDTGQVQLDKESLKNAFEHLGALMPGYKAASALKYIDTGNSGYIKGDELDTLIEYAYGTGYR